MNDSNQQARRTHPKVNLQSKEIVDELVQQKNPDML